MERTDVKSRISELRTDFAEKTSETIQGMEEQAKKEVNYLDLQKALKQLKTEKDKAQTDFDTEKAIAAELGLTPEREARIDKLEQRVKEKEESYEKTASEIADIENSIKENVKENVVDAAYKVRDAFKYITNGMIDKAVAGVATIGAMADKLAEANRKAVAVARTEADTIYTNVEENIHAVNRNYLSFNYNRDKVITNILDKVTNTLEKTFQKSASIKEAFKDLGRALMGKERQHYKGDYTKAEKFVVEKLRGLSDGLKQEMGEMENQFNLSKQISMMNLMSLQETRSGLNLRENSDIKERFEDVKEAEIDSFKMERTAATELMERMNPVNTFKTIAETFKTATEKSEETKSNSAEKTAEKNTEKTSNKENDKAEFVPTETEDKKYALTGQYIFHEGRHLHRIQALKDFGDVKAGDLGGWVESEENLSQQGNAWIYDNAKVYDNARVLDNATIRDNAEVSYHAVVAQNASVDSYGRVEGHSIMKNQAKVTNSAWLGGNAVMYGQAQLAERAFAHGNSEISGRAMVCGNAKLMDNVTITSNAIIRDHALVTGDATVSGAAQVGDHAKIGDNAQVKDSARVTGSVQVCENAIVGGNAVLYGDKVITTNVSASKDDKPLEKEESFNERLDAAKREAGNTKSTKPDNTENQKEKLMVFKPLAERFDDAKEKSAESKRDSAEKTAEKSIEKSIEKAAEKGGMEKDLSM